MVTKIWSAFYKESGSAFYNESGSAFYNVPSSDAHSAADQGLNEARALPLISPNDVPQTNPVPSAGKTTQGQHLLNRMHPHLVLVWLPSSSKVLSVMHSQGT